MRSIVVCTLAAISLAGCTYPRCCEMCPIFDPTQYGCGPRVPYYESPCGNVGCGLNPFMPLYGPYGPVYGYNSGQKWDQPVVTQPTDRRWMPDSTSILVSTPSTAWNPAALSAPQAAPVPAPKAP